MNVGRTVFFNYLHKYLNLYSIGWVYKQSIPSIPVFICPESVRPLKCGLDLVVYTLCNIVGEIKHYPIDYSVEMPFEGLLVFHYLQYVCSCYPFYLSMRSFSHAKDGAVIPMLFLYKHQAFSLRFQTSLP